MAIFFGPIEILALAADDRAAHARFGPFGRPGIVEKKSDARAGFGGQVARGGSRNAERSAGVELFAPPLPHDQHLPRAPHRHKQRRNFVAAARKLFTLDEAANRTVQGGIDFRGGAAQGRIFEHADHNRVGFGLGDARVDGMNLHGTASQWDYELEKLPHFSGRFPVGPGIRSPPSARVSAGNSPGSGWKIVESALPSPAPCAVSYPDAERSRIAAAQVVARRRRGVHHAAAGLHRGRRSPRLAALEPGHVSRAAFGRPVCSRTAKIGLHYQIHRGIGVHHAAAIRRGEPLRVNIFVGGPPAMTLAAVMPLPEGMPELTFAGALRRGAACADRSAAGNCRSTPTPISASPARSIPNRNCPKARSAIIWATTAWRIRFPGAERREGVSPRDAIWPFTVVGRPPQEDTIFGQIIHEITGPIIPTVVPGVHAVHAVDAAGVHPLLLAIGSERYTPYAERRRPQELLTTANAILGQGQLSLAKYLLDRRPGRQPGARHPRHRRRSSGICWSGSTGAATCTFRRARRSTRSTIRAAA